MCKTSVDSVGALALSLKDTYIIIRTEWFGTIRDVSIRGRVTVVGKGLYNFVQFRKTFRHHNQNFLLIWLSIHVHVFYI